MTVWTLSRGEAASDALGTWAYCALTVSPAPETKMPVASQYLVGSRASNLAKAQVREYLAPLRAQFPKITFTHRVIWKVATKTAAHCCRTCPPSAVVRRLPWRGGSSGCTLCSARACCPEHPCDEALDHLRVCPAVCGPGAETRE
ncbi:hypothetical protein Areg01_85590 [Actinoplanes regularis]|nr:hypothetical protein Areg01_85590 [Actinoplanes regularis]